jgi:hypothetical protein
MDYYGSDVDPPNYRTEHIGTRHSAVLPRQDLRSLPEKGKRGYKVSSIQDGTMHLTWKLIAGKLVRKNFPTQVTGFVVDLARKCVEGM